MLLAWSATLTRWWPPAFRSNTVTSAMWDSQVRGCQFASAVVVKAQATEAGVSPWRTCGFSVT